MNTKNKVWRFNIHTHEGIKRQCEVFDYCKRKNILGTGWQCQHNQYIVNSHIISDQEFQEIINNSQDYPSNIGFKKTMKALRQIKKGDYIWTRRNNEYYICQITGEPQDYVVGDNNEKDLSDQKDYDIYHYISCNFKKIGTEDKIFGIITNSFNAGTICEIGKTPKDKSFALTYSNSIYNNTKEKIIDRNQLLECFKPLELEEIIGLYLQVELKYGIYTSTVKANTKEYEYILFSNNHNQTAKVQVKSGNINLINYTLDDNQIFYFFTLENYYFGNKKLTQKDLDSITSKNSNIHFISKQNILNFIDKYKNDELLKRKYQYIFNLLK